MADPALKQDHFTYAEYLDIEAQSEERHIFWDGEIFAMAGGSLGHTRLESNLHGLLFIALGGRPCHPYTGNQRLRAPEGDRAVYTDAVVICGRRETHPDDADAVTNPVVVFEVLSKSTKAFDRGDKFAYYRTFPSLRAVVFVSQKTAHIERYSRDERGVWTLTDIGRDDTLDLPEIGVSLVV